MRAWLEKLAAHCRIVRYDAGGTGLSSRDSFDFSLDGQAAEMEAVIDHLGLASVALWGGISGGPIALAFAGTRPHRVSHVLLWTSYISAADLGWVDAAAVGAMRTQNWKLFTETFAHAAFQWSNADLASEYAALTRDAMSQEVAIEGWRAIAAHDATPYLAGIRCPTLVMTRRDERLFTVDLARRMCEAIPRARLLVLPGSETGPYMGDSDAVVRAAREFLEQPPAEPAPAAPMKLSPREAEVLGLLAGGRTAREIAEALSISLPTAQRHISNIYAKIGARGRVEAVTYALQRGIVRPRDE